MDNGHVAAKFDTGGRKAEPARLDAKRSDDLFLRPAGFEYDLVKAFAKDNGYKIELVLKDSVREVMHGVLVENYYDILVRYYPNP